MLSFLTNDHLFFNVLFYSNWNVVFKINRKLNIWSYEKYEFFWVYQKKKLKVKTLDTKMINVYRKVLKA